MKTYLSRFPASREIIRDKPWILCLVLALLFPVLFESCQKTDTFQEDLDMYLKSLPPISDAMPDEQTPEINNTEVDTTLEYIYKTDYYKAAAGFNEQIVLKSADRCDLPRRVGKRRIHP